MSLISIRAAAALLFGLKANDPLALAACYPRVLRAARIHPTEALREE